MRKYGLLSKVVTGLALAGVASGCVSEGAGAATEESDSAGTGEQDVDLYYACEDLVRAAEACGYASSLRCATFASTERPEMAANYACLAQLPCEAYGTPGAGGECAPPPSTFGDELCEAVARCKLCSSEDVAALNAYGAWLKDEVLASAKSCANQASCTDQSDCLLAWREAIQ